MIKISNSKLIMISVLSWALIIISCGDRKSKKNKLSNRSDKSSVVKISFKFQLPRKEYTQLISSEDSFSIIYFDNFIVYKIPVAKSHANTKMSRNGELYEDIPFKTEVINQYYAMEKGESFGYKFDSLNGLHPQRVSMDSFFLKRSILKGTQSFYNAQNDKLVKSEVCNDTLIESYIPGRKLDDSYPDSSYFFLLSGRNDKDFSLSKDMEVEKGSKLVRVRIVYNAISNNRTKGVIPRREFELKRIDTIMDNRPIERLINIIKKT